MAHLRCDFFSDVLGLSTSMTVILPQQTSAQIGLHGTAPDSDPPVLYLLHGLSDDDTIWLRRTAIERYVAAMGLAVVMPQVHRSFYTDEARGLRYWTFLTEELPELVSRFFRVSSEPTETFVAGLSMGGYGAFKWALRHPGRFAAAASLSGALNIAGKKRSEGWPQDPAFADRLFGNRSRPAATMTCCRWSSAPACPPQPAPGFTFAAEQTTSSTPTTCTSVTQPSNTASR